MKYFTIYTDGSCIKNPGGAGGWVAIVLNDREKVDLIEIHGGEESTTNNRMELTAAIKGLELVEEGEVDVLIYTDSQYLSNAFSKGWVKKWSWNGWKTSNRTPVKNQDLWIELMALVKKRSRVEFRWIKGHDGNVNNEKCDRLANQEALRFDSLKKQ